MERDHWIETARAAIEEAVGIAGSQSRLAAMLKGKYPTMRQVRVHQWLRRGFAAADGGICLEIERLTGVPKERLRPDVYQVDPGEPPAATGEKVA